ncbi:Exportin-1 [Venturia nashicola]|nr:Exportin-1 [Venturia nashicola]
MEERRTRRSHTSQRTALDTNAMEICPRDGEGNTDRPSQTLSTSPQVDSTETDSTTKQSTHQPQRTQAQLDLGAHYIAWESGSQIIPGFTSYTQYPQTFFRRPPVSSWYKIVPGPRVNSGFTLRLKDEAADEEAVAMLYLEAMKRSAARRSKVAGTAL